MRIISITGDNIEQEHICCAIGNDRENRARAQTKKEWMKGQFAQGLVFKRLDARGKAFIEYMPIEKVWKPLIGRNYLVINCLWVSGQFKGKGYSVQLLDECVRDAKEAGMDGIAVVSGAKLKPFLTDRRFFLARGFELVDVALPYFELLALTFKAGAQTPRFSEGAKRACCDNRDGFTFIYSNQCPFMEEYVGLLERLAREQGFHCETVRLSSCAEAQELGSPFGTLGIYYQGAFLTHELMAEGKFRKLLEEVGAR